MNRADVDHRACVKSLLVRSLWQSCRWISCWLTCLTEQFILGPRSEEHLKVSGDNILQNRWSSILRQSISYSVICSRSSAFFSNHRADINVYWAADEGQKNNSTIARGLAQVCNSISCVDYSLISDCIMPMNHVDIVFVNMNCWEWLVASHKLAKSGWMNLVSLLLLQLCTAKTNNNILKWPEQKNQKLKYIHHITFLHATSMFTYTKCT